MTARETGGRLETLRELLLGGYLRNYDKLFDELHGKSDSILRSLEAIRKQLDKLDARGDAQELALEGLKKKIERLDRRTQEIRPWP